MPSPEHQLMKDAELKEAEQQLTEHIGDASKVEFFFGNTGRPPFILRTESYDRQFFPDLSEEAYEARANLRQLHLGYLANHAVDVRLYVPQRFVTTHHRLATPEMHKAVLKQIMNQSFTGAAKLHVLAQKQGEDTSSVRVTADDEVYILRETADQTYYGSQWRFTGPVLLTQPEERRAVSLQLDSYTVGAYNEEDSQAIIGGAIAQDPSSSVASS